jgi:CRP-like cAMP-binding protein
MLKFPVQELKAMLLGNASLQMLFLCKAAHTIRESERQILLLLHKSPVDRLASLVARLGQPTPGIPQALPWAERELASYLGLTPRQLEAAARSLEADGIVRRSRRTLTVVNPRKLRQLVADPPAADHSPVQRRHR